MAGSSDREVRSRQHKHVPIEETEITDEEREVLKDCSRNSILYRGLPLGVASTVVLRELLIRTGWINKLQNFKGLMYTGMFALTFYSGVQSYGKTCIAKIMALPDTSHLKQAVMKNLPESAGKTNFYEDNLNFQGNQREEEPSMDMQFPLSRNTATPNNRSSEDDRKAPNLYFDVDEAKEKKYATYEDLRKKHRERWNPPNLSSSSQTRKEQIRQQPREADQDNKTSSNDVFTSWFDREEGDDDRSSQETGQRTSNQRERPSYRQGPTPRKNKYGDLIE
ncbi:uncharacterized protein LOC111341273 [Stylophora pistillata]|uniref:OCIA domain-containing protein 1 n=1 Tax=Stylophora pistillata TaxID=50429 RepID=A0A2B4RLM1_STYPI|nr:uncharacterized protein LOC111341273 [Stylophora pistillata]PFX17142.1 OCIA domain-containing protein 1 [Stylophora pistillata]